MDIIGAVKVAVEIGFAIKDSIDKVGQNSKRSRQLTDDIVETLADLKTLYNNDERGFAGAVHLGEASARLRCNLESVHSLCQNLVPEQKRGKLLVKAKVTYAAWKNRDNIEGELLRLKEHAADCLAKFTAFSTARTENAVTRSEHALTVHAAEMRYKFSHLDILLINSPWGEQALKSTEINICNNQSIERQYLTLQVHGLVQRVQVFFAAGCLLQNEQPNSKHRTPLLTVARRRHRCGPSIVVIRDILSLRCSIEDVDHAPPMQEIAWKLNDLGWSLTYLKLSSEAKAAHQGASHIYRSLSQHHRDFLPYMVLSDLNFMDHCIDEASLVIPMIQRATAALDSYEIQTGADARVLRACALCTEGQVFLNGKDFESASQSFLSSLNLYKGIIRNTPLIFLGASSMAGDQLAAIFRGASKACCGYAECMVDTDRAQEAVSTVMQGLSQYQHLPSWAMDDYDEERFGQSDMSKSLTSAMIKLYAEGQLSIAFLHTVVRKLLTLAVLRPILSITLWATAAIYASLSAAHSTVSYYDIIPNPVSPTFTLENAYDTLPIRLPSRLAELLWSVDIEILFHEHLTHPWSSDLYFTALVVGRIVNIEYIKKHAEMLEEHKIPPFLGRLSFILGSHTPEEHRLPILEVVNMLFARISCEKRRSGGGEWYAHILFQLGIYASALAVTEEYVNTPLNLLHVLSVRIICLVKVGRTSDTIPFAQPCILEFWSQTLSWSEAGSSWADVCENTQLSPETSTAMKMAWMLSAGYHEDVPGVEIYETYRCSLKRVVNDLHELAIVRGGSQGACTHLIPRELWDMFRSKCSDTDPATLLVGSLTLDLSSVPLTLNSPPLADLTPTLSSSSRAPFPQPTNSTSASHPEATHASQSKDPLAGSGGGGWAPILHIGLDILVALVLSIQVALFLVNGRAISLNFN